jgi:predicted HAD superfamily Cof-like phosphohydrolase
MILDRSKHQQSVDNFMVLAKQDLPKNPTIPDEKIRWLRAKLILEEAFETVEALGFKPTTEFDGDAINRRDITFGQLDIDFDMVEPNLAEIVDGCCDIKVVTTGTLSACGVPDEVFQDEVDRANLRKFGPGGHRREDGKWVKPADFVPPNIAGLLEKVTEAAEKQK